MESSRIAEVGGTQPAGQPAAQSSRRFATSNATLLDQAYEIAADALDQARSSLMTVVPFMDVALWRMPFAPRSLSRALGTDGRLLHLDALSVIREYKADPAEILRDYLHAILHCVFRHPFDGKHPHLDAWDTACDIAVEATAMELVGMGFPSEKDDARRRALAKLQEACPQLTAGKLYKALLPVVLGTAEAEKSVLSSAFVKSLPSLFRRDDHSLWPRTDEQHANRKGVAEEKSQLIASSGKEHLRGEDDDVADDEEKDNFAGIDMPGAPARSSSSTAAEGDVEDGDTLVDVLGAEAGMATFASMEGVLVGEFDDISWQDISARIQLDLEAFTGKVGSDAGTFMVNLSVANRKRYDYRDFLKRFAALSEELKVSTEEFDYIYYTYGLTRYKNMPLIEPLEYQESNRIKDFVIAIDTSASCTGTFVHEFVEKTYDVLKNTEGFGRKVNIHVIQCDCDIRSDTKITEIRDLENVFGDFSTRGHGGTDFRPVFKHVDELIESRELTDLKGLIYFTDGLGKFPESPPAYETAFIFVDDGQRERKVPPWAMKVVMDEDDILEL